MGSPAGLNEYLAWLLQNQQAQQMQPTPVAPPPASGSGLDANPPDLAALAARVGRPGGGFGVAAAGQTPANTPQVPTAEEGVYPDKFDQGGRRWRWNPKTRNYQIAR